MVALPEPQDPTLEAVDRALEARGNRPWRMPSLPMSEIGKECERAIWYGFRWAGLPTFDATALKRFADGHTGEDLQASRLRLVDGLELWTVDPETGKQWAHIDHEGHFRGAVDGIALGLLQAPATPHLWEHKQVNEASQRKLAKLKIQHGEKNALKEWKPEYWATAQCYMKYFQLDRHYMTVGSPGGRHTISVRTELDKAAAEELIAKAGRIIKTDRAPARISEKPDFFKCKFCDFNKICHESALPAKNCRTCLHSTPVDNGRWHCGKFDWYPDRDEQREAAECPAHLFVPSLINAEQVDVAEDGSWVEYKMPNGDIWRNENE